MQIRLIMQVITTEKWLDAMNLYNLTKYHKYKKDDDDDDGDDVLA